MPRICLMQLFMPRIAPECISETLNLRTIGAHTPRVARFLIKIVTQLSLPLCKDMCGYAYYSTQSRKSHVLKWKRS